MSRDKGFVRYLVSTLAKEHLIVVGGVLLWLGSAVWQLWTFGGRPEIWVAAILMGLGAGAIGFYLATINRVDSDEQVVALAISDEGERHESGDPLDPQLGRVAAIIAGNDHSGWLTMSQSEREVYYRRAEAVISAVRQVTEDDA